jgi:hypothetical protein
MKAELKTSYFPGPKSFIDLSNERSTIDLISEIMEYISLPDRTISLQFQKFRKPRNDLNELIVKDDMGTYRLNDHEKIKYKQAIHSLMDTHESHLDDNINIDLPEIINIDIEGFSLEVANILGNDYLNGIFILVSINQLNCCSIRNNNYDILKRLFEGHKKIIEQLLSGESLIGKIYIRKKIENGNYLSLVNLDPEEIFNTEINFDTPNNAISRTKKIKDDEIKLYKDYDLIKDRRFLKDIFENIEIITRIHGSIDRIPTEKIYIKEKTDFYKIIFGNLELFCLNIKNPVFIYFDDNNNGQNICVKDCIIINGNDDGCVNKLVSLKIIGYNPYLGLERIANMISRIRKEKLRKQIIYMEEDDIKNLPIDVKKLLSAIRYLITHDMDINYFNNLEHQIKIYMIYPLIQNEVLYELITRLEKNDKKSNYIKIDNFFDIVKDLNTKDFKFLMIKILENLEFEQENNFIINSWLKENKMEECKEIGIKFRKYSTNQQLKSK